MVLSAVVLSRQVLMVKRAAMPLAMGAAMRGITEAVSGAEWENITAM